MNRAEFMEKLRELLSDISESEREEALNYYEDYFDDAGEENEQSVIESLGSPEKVARTIKDGLNDGNGENGEFSENGFRGYGDDAKNEVGKREKVKFSDRIRGLGTGGMILVLILAIFALPILAPILLSIVSVIFGMIMAVIGLLFAALIAGIALVMAGVGVFAAAVVSLITSPAVSVLLIGVSFLLVGIGILLAILGGWIVWKVVPSIIRWIVNLFSRLFHKKEVQ